MNNESSLKTLAAISICVSSLSAIISIIAIALNAPRYSKLGFDYTAVIVAAFALIVTALIGLQVAQYIFSGDRMQKIAEEVATREAKDTAITEMDNMLKDARVISKASFPLFDAKFCRVIGKNLQCIHEYMIAIQEYQTIENKAFSLLLIEDVLQKILTLPERFFQEGHLVVYKDQIENYKKIVADTDCPSTDKIQDLLSQSVLQEEDELDGISQFYTD